MRSRNAKNLLFQALKKERKKINETKVGFGIVLHIPQAARNLQLFNISPCFFVPFAFLCVFIYASL